MFTSHDLYNQSGAGPAIWKAALLQFYLKEIHQDISINKHM